MTTAIQSAQPQKVGDLFNTSKPAGQNFQAQLTKALGNAIPPDYWMRVALTCCRKNPKLMQCNPMSMYDALMQAAQLRLLVDGVVGQAWLVPYGGNVQLIPGYKGLMALAYRAGVKSIRPRSVYSRDVFEYSFGLNDTLDHQPYPGDDRGELTHVYAIATLSDGTKSFDVMPLAEIDKIKSLSKGAAKPDSPWRNHYEAMAWKTVIRRLCKFLPVSVEAQRVIAEDEQRDAGIIIDHGPAEEAKPEVITIDDLLDESAAVEIVDPEGEPIPVAEEKPKPKRGRNPKKDAEPEQELDPLPDPEVDPGVLYDEPATQGDPEGVTL